MGADAAALLLDRIDNPSRTQRTQTLTPQLIVRGSSSLDRAP
jgi:DNA-binding LacI/PurR family transcriptional regulator